MRSRPARRSLLVLLLFAGLAGLFLAVMATSGAVLSGALAGGGRDAGIPVRIDAGPPRTGAVPTAGRAPTPAPLVVVSAPVYTYPAEDHGGGGSSSDSSGGHHG